MKILKGKKIKKFYRTTEKTKSSMTGDKFSKFISFYALNVDKVSLVVSNNKDARALLWLCDDGTLLMDDIYGNGADKLINWVIKNNLYFIRTIPDDKLSSLRITMKYKYKDRFPYIDNMNKGKFISDTELVLSYDMPSANIAFLSHKGDFIELRKNNAEQINFYYI